MALVAAVRALHARRMHLVRAVTVTQLTRLGSILAGFTVAICFLVVVTASALILGNV